MKKIFLLIIALCTMLNLWAQESEIDAAWIKRHYSKSECMVAMRDGAKLYTAIYAPKNKKLSSPVLMCRTQKGCEPYGKKATALPEQQILHSYLREGYILVFQDVRGYGKSLGAELSAQCNVTDAYDTASWLIRRLRRTNGSIGVWGSGDDSTFALQAAECGHSAIKAVTAQDSNCKITPESVGYHPAVLYVGGWWDLSHSQGSWLNFWQNPGATTTDCRLVIGPWLDGAWRLNEGGDKIGDIEFSNEASAEFFRTEIEFPFFDLYLRGEGDGGASSAGALIYVTGENCWREYEKEQVLATETCNLYLDCGSRLLQNESQELDSATSYTSDDQSPVPYYIITEKPIHPEYVVANQSFLANRDDVIEFSTPQLEQDVQVMGEVEMEIYFTASQQDVNFVVKIIDEANDDDEMMVKSLYFGAKDMISEPSLSNKPQKLRFKFPPIAHTFMAGHRLKLQIHSSWYPLYEGGATNPIEVNIHHNREQQSRIILPVVK